MNIFAPLGPCSCFPAPPQAPPLVPFNPTLKTQPAAQEGPSLATGSMLRGPSSDHSVSGLGQQETGHGSLRSARAGLLPSSTPSTLLPRGTHTSTHKSKESHAGLPGLQNTKAASLNREEIRPWASSPSHDSGLEAT